MPGPIRSEEFGLLQHAIDALYLSKKLATRLDLVLAVEAADLCDDLQEIVSLLPPGTYTREGMCDQLNSSISAHGWGLVYGTVQ